MSRKREKHSNYINILILSLVLIISLSFYFFYDDKEILFLCISVFSSISISVCTFRQSNINLEKELNQSIEELKISLQEERELARASLEHSFSIFKETIRADHLPMLKITKVSQMENNNQKYKVDFMNVGIDSAINIFYREITPKKDNYFLLDQRDPWGDSLVLGAKDTCSLVLTLKENKIDNKNNYWGVFGLSFKDIYANQYYQNFEFTLNNYPRIISYMPPTLVEKENKLY